MSSTSEVVCSVKTENNTSLSTNTSDLVQKNHNSSQDVNPSSNDQQEKHNSKSDQNGKNDQTNTNGQKNQNDQSDQPDSSPTILKSNGCKRARENGNAVISESLRTKFLKYKGGRVVLEKDDTTGIAVIRLDNPQRKNSLSGSMMIDLSQIVDELEHWDKGKGIIFHGTGGFFSSGGDMNTVKLIDNSEDGRDMGTLMYDSLQRLQKLPMISVALIEGKAIGGGAELTTACDFRLMSETAKIGFVHIKLGITVSWGGGTRLVQIVGTNKALELLTSGRQLTAKEALEIGLINGVLSEPQTPEEPSVLLQAKEWLSQHTHGPPETIAIIKKIIYSSSSLLSKESLKNEFELFPQLWGSPPHKKALSMNIKLR